MEFVLSYVVCMSVIEVFDRAFYHVMPKSQNRFRSNMELELNDKHQHNALHTQQ